MASSIINAVRQRLTGRTTAAPTTASLSTPEETKARTRARRRKLVLSKVARAIPALQLLLALAGYLQFIAVPFLAKKSYIDENAFQPGQVNTYFGWSDVTAADRYADGLQRFVGSNDSLSRSLYIMQALQDHGLLAQIQHIRSQEDLSISKYNAYARLRAPKTSGSEALVLCAAWESRQPGMKNVRGTATLLALAKHLQRLSMWSKDIFLVFTDGQTEGLQDWLSAYFGAAKLGVAPLELGGGAIWGAVALDYPYHSFSHLGLYYDGVNGRLPNLDIVHGAAYISKWIGGVPVRLHNSTTTDNLDVTIVQNRLKQYKERATGLLQQLSYSAGTLPSGPEGLFSQYGVDFIGLFAVPAEGPHGFYTIGRVVESVLRAFNNLTERLHASFFLYLLPEPFHFLPVATYLSAPLLIGASLTLAGLRIWHTRATSSIGNAYALIVTSYVLGGMLCVLGTRLTPQTLGFIVPILGGVPYLYGAKAPSQRSLMIALNCLLTGMVISVLTILNFGLGAMVAILNGTTCLSIMYTSSSQKRGALQILIYSIVAAAIGITVAHYAASTSSSYGTQAIATYVLYLGIVPLWLQLMWA